MILQALTACYEAFVAQGILSPPGWDDACKVSFGLELTEDGTLAAVIPYQRTEQAGKKEKTINNQLMRMPARVKRSSGIAPNFLCDTSSYLLGVDAKGKPKRAKDCFAACSERHHALLDNVDSPAARAVLMFFDTWDPDKADACPALAADWRDVISGGNLVFCYDMEPVSEDPAIACVWQNAYDASSEDVEIGQCLVTGQTGPLARLHPSIKGVLGAQSSGAALVSFNALAYNSYGHTQGGNAPVSEYAAFAYTTALNTLLADREHCRTIGDTTVVCWSESGEKAYQDLGMSALFGPPAGLDDQLLSAVLHRMAQGKPCQWQDITLQPEEHFYFLGLAPNASRLSVRFFLRDSFGAFMEHIDKHYQDTAIVRPSYDARENLPVWLLLNETVNQNSRTKSASPQLAGNVLQAILSGTPYPATLLNGAELRIRAEHDITRGRAAILKAYYLRQPHLDCPEEVLQMELNEKSTNIPYTLGRMFSIYEQIQQAANPGINATIKDKYFNSASATPSIIFPLLGNLAQKHLRVIRRDNGGLGVYLERKLGDLSAVVGETFPDHLTLPQQGSFQLGYYFENQARYQKKH